MGLQTLLNREQLHSYRLGRWQSVVLHDALHGVLQWESLWALRCLSTTLLAGGKLLERWAHPTLRRREAS